MISTSAMADDKPIDVSRLPEKAQKFLKDNFDGVKVLYALQDDDFINPDYEVRLEDGTKLDFEHNGSLDKISNRSGVLLSLVPVQIRDYIKAHYPEAIIVSYDPGRRDYEVELSNGLELKFSTSFHLIEIDD